MSSTSHSEENRWINPRRPLTATPHVNCELAGGGGGSIRPLNRPGSRTVEEILAKVRRPKYGALRVRRPPTAMTDGSGGLSGGGHPQSTPLGRSESALPVTHPFHSNATIPDPYWIGGGMYGWMERLGAESDDEELAPDSTLEDFSISDLSPVCFPFPMEGEEWEAAVKKAEKEMKEEGFTWTETDDDGPRRP